MTQSDNQPVNFQPSLDELLAGDLVHGYQPEKPEDYHDDLDDLLDNLPDTQEDTQEDQLELPLEHPGGKGDIDHRKEAEDIAHFDEDSEAVGTELARAGRKEVDLLADSQASTLVEALEHLVAKLAY